MDTTEVILLKLRETIENADFRAALILFSEFELAVSNDVFFLDIRSARLL